MPFVIYGVTTNTSISALFLSGIVPGLIMGAGLIVAWRLVLRRMDLPHGEPLPHGASACAPPARPSGRC